MFALLLPPAGVSLAEQTRDQCEKCCQNSQQDEYYLEQCRLKCFRNPDHCSGQKAHREAAPRPSEAPVPPAAAQQPPPATDFQPPEPAPGPPAMGEPARPMPPPRPAQPKAAPPKAAFIWPNPLNLVPGREWEAAGLILAANGISPQNPNYQAGLKSIEAVLIEFAKANPGGGKLPTTQLERIIRQIR